MQGKYGDFELEQAGKGLFFSHTKLYSDIEPIRVGTPYQESLTNYLSRLAEEHSVTTGTLVSSEIARVLNKVYLQNSSRSGGSRFYEGAAAINGIGKIAADFAEALNMLTGRSDLQQLTLLAWQDILPARELLRGTRAWCPSCLTEWLNAKEVIYEPLIWNIAVVETCPIHKASLQMHCPHCGRQNPVLTRKSRPGLCATCGGWLGECDLNNSLKDTLLSGDQEWQTWVHVNVGQMITLPTNGLSDDVCERVERNLSDIIKGAGSVTRLAKILGQPKTTLRTWRDGKTKPTLKSLLQLGYYAKITLAQMVMDEYFSTNLVINGGIERLSVENRQNRRHFGDEAVQRSLEEVLANRNLPPPSMRKVAESLGYDKRLLYRHFPDKCKAISQAYTEHLRKSKIDRVDGACLRVREVTLGLYQSGIYPSRRQVEAALSPGILHEAVIQQAWQNTLQDLGLR